MFSVLAAATFSPHTEESVGYFFHGLLFLQIHSFTFMSISKFLKIHQKTIRVQLREGPHFMLFISSCNRYHMQY